MSEASLNTFVHCLKVSQMYLFHMNSLKNDVYNLLVNTHVQIKIYQKF